MKILIADDESIIRTGIRCIIERTKKEWVVSGVAEDGIEALEQMKSELPDLVITDVRMPEMDGIRLSERIKQLYPQVLVVIVSGYSEFQYAKDAISVGVMEYIVKPTKPEELIGALERAQTIIEQRAKEKPAQADSAAFLEYTKSTQYRKCIALAIEYIMQNYAKNITLKDIASVVFMNPNYLCDLFKQETGVQFSNYLADVRIVKARKLLRNRLDLKSYEIGNLVGYSDPKHFSQVFKKKVGMTPTEYREAPAE